MALNPGLLQQLLMTQSIVQQQQIGYGGFNPLLNGMGNIGVRFDPLRNGTGDGRFLLQLQQNQPPHGLSEMGSSRSHGPQSQHGQSSRVAALANTIENGNTMSRHGHNPCNVTMSANVGSFLQQLRGVAKLPTSSQDAASLLHAMGESRHCQSS